jgi:tRNA(Ile)-lysidine synthase
MIPAAAVDRFAPDLDARLPAGQRLGLAVSGGPDSMALLLLAAAARPGLVLAGSVDHVLRPGSRAEAEAVAMTCRALGVPHATLAATWDEKPVSAVQERARAERYRLLGRWAGGEGLAAIATGHHADDQAETVLMRLARGAGARGLAAMRRRAPLLGMAGIALLRPLLGWRRAELGAIVAAAGQRASDDPSNHDVRHERVRVRHALAEADWLDPAAVAASAGHLAAADEAIEYAVAAEWEKVVVAADALTYRPGPAPAEIRRRIAARAIAALGTEGDAATLRGREVDALVAALDQGGTATLRGVVASGGAQWRFAPAPARR